MINRVILLVACLHLSSSCLSSNKGVDKPCPTDPLTTSLDAVEGLKRSTDNGAEALARTRGYIRDKMPSKTIEDSHLKAPKAALKDIKVALIVVDYQVDFATGSLAIGAGDAKEDPVARIPNVNQLLSLPFDTIVITKDWHPADHISFLSAARNGDRKLAPNSPVELFAKAIFTQPRREQVLYPDHCVRNTHGAELVPEMKVPARAITVLKGLDTLVDSYSAFMDNEGEGKSELYEVLKREGIDAVVVCGLAYDICVFHTTKDARNLGFYAATVRDASAAFSAAGATEAAKYHVDEKIKEMNTEDVFKMLSTRDWPEFWYQIALEEGKVTNNNNFPDFKQ